MFRHEYFEICYLHTGSIIKQVQDRFFRMEAGDLFVVGSGHFHRISQFLEPRAGEILLYFLPEVIVGGETSAEASVYLAPFLCQDPEFPHVIPAKTGIPSEVYKLVMRIHADLPPVSVRARAYVKTYLRMILVVLGEYYRDSHQGFTLELEHRQRNIERLTRLFDYMDLHYAQRIPVDRAAAIVYMSRSHFMRFFRRVTGHSFVDYLNRLRVAKAEVLLASTDKNIADIAQEVGFCDQSYFSKVFNRFVHLQPREYRNKVRG